MTAPRVASRDEPPREWCPPHRSPSGGVSTKWTDLPGSCITCLAIMDTSIAERRATFPEGPLGRDVDTSAASHAERSRARCGAPRSLPPRIGVVTPIPWGGGKHRGAPHRPGHPARPEDPRLGRPSASMARPAYFSVGFVPT